MYILFVCIIVTNTLIMKQKMHGNTDKAQSSVYTVQVKIYSQDTNSTIFIHKCC